ncbi:hypothetical protein [Halostagnicola kamekurae]|uniref:Uncharacterized protein n=1 Tax=Halostagnicola kamekurae TaxID=619731 RepID=A0A1I6RXR5_9EURY|nr:hypothetical protein [Halostagnicola kamekurae]SFS69497.1 hypothetical protein SAMN04488556_2302 [Halostagnicola kamekurae]
MELSNAAKWTLFNRALTAGAMVLGTGLALLGFVLGFWGSIETLVVDRNVQTAVENANPILTLALAAVGFIVWQIGKTYALFWSLPRASGRAAAKRFDHGRLKSEVVEALDERLAEMEEDVAETRRSVQELKRTEHAAAFDEEDALESTPVQRSESTARSATTAQQPGATASSAATGQQSATDRSETTGQSQSNPAERSASESGKPAESGFEFSSPDGSNSERPGERAPSESHPQDPQTTTETENEAPSSSTETDRPDATDADDQDAPSESDEPRN